MEVVTDEDDNSISFNAGPGLGLGFKQSCDVEEEFPARIRTIDFKQPDLDTRNFKMQGSECIEVRMHAELNMIVLHDHCRPCCDCDDVSDLDSRITTLEAFH